MFDKFKEDTDSHIGWSPTRDTFIKQSYLSSIDIMIDSYENYFNQSIIESPQFEHINYLKKERAKIAQYK